jgi:hypothetical protein
MCNLPLDLAWEQLYQKQYTCKLHRMEGELWIHVMQRRINQTLFDDMVE